MGSQRALCRPLQIWKAVYPLDFCMQKQAGKIRLCEDDHASDGYYVLISLICIVVAMTSALIITYGIEMLI